VAISKTARLTELRALLADRAAVLGNLPEGSAAHEGLKRECDAIYAEIKELEAARGISPQAVLVLLALAALLLWHLAS
jgi:hypothetical protein